MPLWKLTSSVFRLPFSDSGVHVDHPLDRPAADGAEGDVVAREHDAIFLGPIVALRFVESAFERPDSAGIFVGGEELLLRPFLFNEEGVHFRFGPALRADLSALLLELPRPRFEGLLRPRGRKRRARGHEILPFEI